MEPTHSIIAQHQIILLVGTQSNDGFVYGEFSSFICAVDDNQFACFDVEQIGHHTQADFDSLRFVENSFTGRLSLIQRWPNTPVVIEGFDVIVRFLDCDILSNLAAQHGCVNDDTLQKSVRLMNVMQHAASGRECDDYSNASTRMRSELLGLYALISLSLFTHSSVANPPPPEQKIKPEQQQPESGANDRSTNLKSNSGTSAVDAIIDGIQGFYRNARI